MILKKGVLADAEPEYWAKNPGDLAVGNVERAISGEIIERRLSHANLKKDEIEKYTEEVNLQKFNPKGEEEKGIPRYLHFLVHNGRRRKTIAHR